MAESRPGDIFQPGDLLNNTYRIQSLLGRGGTSEVYLARSEISGRVVALKALKSEYSMNEDYLVLMTREEDIREVRHDAIVRYYDNQRTPEGVVYLVMDYVDGPGLDAKLKGGGMNASDLMIVGARVAEGLVAAHARNIVHRDLSPDNIILRNGEPNDAVIIDFGIAKDTNPGAETIVGNEFAGKYSYAAPEQLSGNSDERSDIYALGALLLATFRGKKPDVGANPLEVVERKALPPDTQGVPEPLGSLIAKMCDPVPAKRFQSATDLLRAFRDPAGASGAQPQDAGASELDDATVVAAPPRRASPEPVRETPKSNSATKPEKKKSGLLVPILGVVVIAAGAGAYVSGALDGVLGTGLPVADPYMLIVEQDTNLPLTAVGHVPSEDLRIAMSRLIESNGGTADLEIATGAIGETWGNDVLALLDEVVRLEEFRMVAQGNAVALEGLTENRILHKTVTDIWEASGFPGVLTGEANVLLGPRFLLGSRIEPILDEFADCGPLSLPDIPPTGYPMGQRVTVEGMVADIETRSSLYDEILALSGDRPVTIATQVLNPGLCAVEARLPKAPSGGFDLSFSFGDTGASNPTGRFLVGENPVIDVIIPEAIQDGFIYVSVLDVSGQVFHLLPRINRENNSIAALRNGATGQVSVRVAYSLAEAEGTTDKLAFQVQGPVLGRSKILVLHASESLFDGLRPSESAASYADALAAAQAKGELVLRTLDSAILTTAER